MGQETVGEGEEIGEKTVDILSSIITVYDFIFSLSLLTVCVKVFVADQRD